MKLTACLIYSIPYSSYMSHESDDDLSPARYQLNTYMYLKYYKISKIECNNFMCHHQAGYCICMRFASIQILPKENRLREWPPSSSVAEVNPDTGCLMLGPAPVLDNSRGKGFGERPKSGKLWRYGGLGFHVVSLLDTELAAPSRLTLFEAT